jgi:hypothetical protein
VTRHFALKCLPRNVATVSSAVARFLALESMSSREMEELDRLSRSLHRLYESERLVERYDAMGVAVHDQHRHGDAIDVEDGRRVSESRSVLTWTAQEPLDERPLLWRVAQKPPPLNPMIPIRVLSTDGSVRRCCAAAIRSFTTPARPERQQCDLRVRHFHGSSAR